MNRPNPWSQEAIAELRRLHGIFPELSFTEIAEQMNAAGHKVGRNGCIGKAHRLFLKPRDPPPEIRMWRARKAIAARQAKRGTKIGTPPMSRIPRADVPLVPEQTRRERSDRTGLLIDLDHDQCRWPVEEIGHATYLYCTADKDGHGSWCKTHARLAFDGRRRSA